MKCIKFLKDFVIQMDHPILVRRPDLVLIHNKKRTCHLVDFAILTDKRVKIKENEKIDLDHTWELKKRLVGWLVGWLGFMAYQHL